MFECVSSRLAKARSRKVHGKQRNAAQTPVYRKFPSVGRRAPRRQSAHREMSAAAESRRKHTGESGTLRMELLLRFREIVCKSRLQTACRRAHALINRRTKDKPLYFRRNAARCRRTVLNAACQRKTARRAPKAPCGKAVRHRHAPSAAGFRAGAVRSSPSDRGEHPRHKASPPQTIQPPETPGSGRRENRSPSRSSGREAENSRSMISRGKQLHGSSSGGGAEKLLALP